MARVQGTVSVNGLPVHFSEVITISWTSTDPIPWGHLIVTQNGVKVCEQYQRLDFHPNGDFTLGPTPSWSGGAAEGVIELLPFNTQKGVFGRAYASVKFSILA